MIEVRHPKPEEWDETAELWSFAFGDGPALQKQFYELCGLEGPIALWENGGLRSMLALPEVKLQFGDSWTPVRAGYVYALATGLGYGGKGWASALLNCAAALAKQQGLDCLLTVPARPDLFGFFQKNDFKPGFYLREIQAEPEFAPASPVSPAQYNTLREERLAFQTHIVYSQGQIAFQEALCGLCQRPGSGLYRLELAHGPGCAAIERLKHPLVKELLCDPRDEAQGAAACAALCDAPTRVRVPACAEDGQPFGAIRWLCRQPPNGWQAKPEGWLGLAFD